MKAIILAAGRGSRMQSMTEANPISESATSGWVAPSAFSRIASARR